MRTRAAWCIVGRATNADIGATWIAAISRADNILVGGGGCLIAPCNANGAMRKAANNTFLRAGWMRYTAAARRAWWSNAHAMATPPHCRV